MEITELSNLIGQEVMIDREKAGGCLSELLFCTCTSQETELYLITPQHLSTAQFLIHF